MGVGFDMTRIGWKWATLLIVALLLAGCVGVSRSGSSNIRENNVVNQFLHALSTRNQGQIRALVTADFRFVIESLAGSETVFTSNQMMVFHEHTPTIYTLETPLHGKRQGAVSGYVTIDLERTIEGSELKSRSSGLSEITVTFGPTGMKIAEVVISPIQPTENNPPDIEIIIGGPEFHDDFFVISWGWVNRGGSGYIRMSEFFEHNGVIVSQGNLSSFSSPNAVDVSSVQRRPAHPGHYRIWGDVYYSIDGTDYVLADTALIEFEIEPSL